MAPHHIDLTYISITTALPSYRPLQASVPYPVLNPDRKVPMILVINRFCWGLMVYVEGSPHNTAFFFFGSSKIYYRNKTSKAHVTV